MTRLLLAATGGLAALALAACGDNRAEEPVPSAADVNTEVPAGAPVSPLPGDPATTPPVSPDAPPPTDAPPPIQLPEATPPDAMPGPPPPA